MVKSMRCVYGSNLWNMFTNQVCGCYFSTHFMRSYFISILGVVLFVSVLWIDYMCCVYGYILWDRFTSGVCDSSVECTSRV